MLRRVAISSALALSGVMIIGGVASIFIGEPHPEIATTGVGLLLATGLLANGAKR